MNAAKLPIVFLLHPVGIGATRAMNVLSAKLWIRALVDLLPDAVIAAPWLPYAEAMVDRDRGLRDAIAQLDRSDIAVAVGGDFSRGVITEWNRAGALKLGQVDLTKPPLPGLLTYETFADTRTPAFREAVTKAFQPVIMRAAA